MKLSKQDKESLAFGAAFGALLLGWWLWPKPATARKFTKYEIDADVNSPTFGLPVGRVAESDEMQRLIDESNARIAAAGERE